MKLMICFDTIHSTHTYTWVFHKIDTILLYFFHVFIWNSLVISGVETDNGFCFKWQMYLLPLVFMLRQRKKSAIKFYIWLFLHTAHTLSFSSLGLLIGLRSFAHVLCNINYGCKIFYMPFIYFIASCRCIISLVIYLPTKTDIIWHIMS